MMLMAFPAAHFERKLASATLVPTFEDQIAADGAEESPASNGDTISVGPNVSLGHRGAWVLNPSAIAPTALSAQLAFAFDVGFTNATGSDSWLLGPYNTDGNGDPQADAGATAYSRADTTSTAYVTTTVLRTTGKKTVDYTTPAALVHMDAAIAAGRTKHALAMKQVDETGASHRAEVLGLPQTDATERPSVALTYWAVR